MRSVNPATGEVVGEYTEHREEEVAARLTAAHEAFLEWRGTSLSERTAVLARVAGGLRRDVERHARLMTEEMGKPIGEARAEVEKCAWVCEYYAAEAERLLAPQPVETDARRSFVRFDPIGPVLGIMPWNFPYWQVLRFSAPAVVAGNVALLKHASNVPGCALAIESLWSESGLPPGGFSTLLVPGSAATELVGRSEVAAVTLTGSDAAGRAVAAEAGRQLKKSVLELGGSDPFVVLEDVDPESVAAAAVLGRCINTGQSCIAAKRFIVVDGVADVFERALVDAMAALTVGDPMDPETRIGPLARRDLVDELHEQVERAVAQGARVLLGGDRLDRPGFYYPPTVVTDVKPDSPLFVEETFGPVAPVIRARDREHAVELANRTAFGLGASLWAGDAAAAEALVPRIEAGSVFVNGIVKSDPRLPFGGVKASGYGRELSAFGLREFVNVKTVWVG